GLPTRAAHRLYLCRILRGTWFCGGYCGPAVILYSADAFDAERTNSARPCWHVHCDGCSSSFDLSYPGQHRHGGRFYARYRNTFTFNELRRVIGIVYVSCAWDGDERPHAPLRELKQTAGQVVCIRKEITFAFALRGQSTGSGMRRAGLKQ